MERQDWIDQWCEVPATLHYALHSLDLGQISDATHVSREAIDEAARLFGSADSAAVVYALDNVPEESKRDCVHALVDLALLTGNVGKPGAGIYPMRQGTNEQGAYDVGCVPNRLPGGSPWGDEAARRRLESRWGCTLPDSRGLGVADVFDRAREGRVKCMLLVGDNADLSSGKLGDAAAALDNLDFLVAVDTFLGAAAQRADVVLPRVTFAEKDGTYTNLERRVQRLQPIRQISRGDALSEGQVLCQLARRLNVAGFDYQDSSQIADEIAEIAPIYAGITYHRLEQEAVTIFSSGMDSPQPTQLLYASKERRGVQWPCGEDGASTAVLYAGGFPNEKADPITPEFMQAEASADPEYPLWFVPGRVLLQADREMEITGEKMNRIARAEWVQMNPADAARWSLTEGDAVEVRTRQHQLSGIAKPDAAVPPGMVAVTTLFGQMVVDLQASEAMDPMSRTPTLDIAPAAVGKPPAVAPRDAGP